MKPETIINVLESARELIVKGWTRFTPARDRRGKEVESNDASACRWCLGGAISAVLPSGLSLDDRFDFDRAIIHEIETTLGSELHGPKVVLCRDEIGAVRNYYEEEIPNGWVKLSEEQSVIGVGIWNDHQRSKVPILKAIDMTILRLQSQSTLCPSESEK